MARSSAVVMGCSAGGLRAMEQVLSSLSPELPAPVMLVCHTASNSLSLLCELLARHSALPVCEADERQPARPGVVYLAPSGYHLLLERNETFALSADDKVCFCRPSIDVLFESAAACFGPTLLGVIMTGANEDGARGLQAVRRRGGLGIVQQPEQAEAPEMPTAALRLAGADHVAALADIASLINRYCLS